MLRPATRARICLDRSTRTHKDTHLHAPVVLRACCRHTLLWPALMIPTHPCPLVCQRFGNDLCTMTHAQVSFYAHLSAMCSQFVLAQVVAKGGQGLCSAWTLSGEGPCRIKSSQPSRFHDTHRENRRKLIYFHSSAPPAPQVVCPWPPRAEADGNCCRCCRTMCWWHRLSARSSAHQTPLLLTGRCRGGSPCRPTCKCVREQFRCHWIAKQRQAR